jgi:hypothetical protein
MMILKETKIKKDIELDKYKNLARHLANEVEYLLDEIESLKKQLEQSKNNNYYERQFQSIGSDISCVLPIGIDHCFHHTILFTDHCHSVGALAFEISNSITHCTHRRHVSQHDHY